MTETTRTIYVVQSRYWPLDERHHLGWVPEEDEDAYLFGPAGEGGTPVKAFTDPDKAEAFRRAREDEKRAEASPFHQGSELAHLTSLDLALLHDWLLDAGLDGVPLTEELAVWRAWWREQRPRLTDLQRAKVWEALDKVRFYEVLALEAAPSKD
jgi:hypothetical protein